MEVNIMKIVLFCIVSVCVFARDEIPDFEFDDTSATTLKPIRRESSFNFDDFDDFLLESGNEPEYDIATKEKIVQRALFKALAAKDLKNKFSEVLPLLRALSKSQRMVFASIISAQINGGKSLTLDEVKTMFGDSNTVPLLLPIVFDLANLVREGFLRSDKYQEHERQDKNQFLRRSFQVDSKKSRSTKEIDFSAPPNSMRDDTLNIEEDEPKTKDIGENSEDLKPEALMMINNSSLSQERFMLSADQDNPTRNMSLEEIENLAFSDLNGTTLEQIKDINNGSLISPMPLIGRYRKKHPYRSRLTPETCERFTGGICLNVKNYPMNDIMGSIRRHRYAMEALLAEYRDKTAELEQLDYLGDPTADLTDLRRRDDSEGVSAPGSMCTSVIRYARPQKARSATGEWKFIVNTGEHTQTLRLEKCSQPLEPCSYLTENFESSCTQVYNYHRLLSWDNERGLHVDIFKVPTCCSCHLVGYKEAFPPLGTPSNSISSVPSSNKRPSDYDAFSSSSNRNSQYSTLAGSDDENDDDDDENDDSNIAYQFGNGFKRIKPKKPPTIVPDLNEGLKNRQPLSKRNQPETFLKPPANNKDSNFPFSNSIPSRRGSQIFKRKQFDQIAAASDLKISRLTVLPPKVYSQSERPQKITPSISSTIDTSSVNLRLPNAYNTDQRRINYNYHPIIDFFENEEPQKNNLDHKTGKLVADDNWKPMVGG